MLMVGAVGKRWLVVGRTLMTVAIAADLLTFAGAFYPQAPGRDLHVSSPAVQELVSRSGPYHVLIDPGLYHLLGANQLVHYGVSVAGGYSSLEPSRFVDYWWSLVRDENVLQDL